MNRLEEVSKLNIVFLVAWLGAMAIAADSAAHAKDSNQFVWILLLFSAIAVYNAFSLRRPYEWVWAFIWLFMPLSPLLNKYVKINSTMQAVILVLLVVIALAYQRWCQDQKQR